MVASAANGPAEDQMEYVYEARLKWKRIPPVRLRSACTVSFN